MNAPPKPEPPAAPAARRLVLNGRVQGVGFRPALYRRAAALGLAGSVRNAPEGVVVEVEGEPAAVAAFSSGLAGSLPAAARLETIDQRPIEPTGRVGFAIGVEADTPAPGPLAARVPVDRAVCSDCLAEVDAPADRRHGHPFASCTDCGPRFSIVEAMPYQRRSTTMGRFDLCPRCRAEFADPADRRFHAETIACPDCGPRVACADRSGRRLASDRAAVDLAARALRDGRIVALRGLGGYQLLVDATEEAAVDRLRARKRRPAKPLAVLVGSIELARRLARLDPIEERAFTDPSNPIVVAPARADSGLARGVHPGQSTVGLLLPTTPLHHQLAAGAGRPLVCTSGNVDGEPLAVEPAEALRALAGVADLFLDHDRPIALALDDSVVRVIAGRAVPLRLARGLAPLPLDLPRHAPVLAAGGHQKAALAWSNGAQAALGPHVGDLDGEAVRRRLLEQAAAIGPLYRFEPECLAHDRHPGYFSTGWAIGSGRPTVAVQHHHAHVVAGMIAPGWLDRAVLGVAWDGTGDGGDGTVWGGEFLVATTRGFERLARLRPFRLPGGEAAIRQPWRSALAVLDQAVGRERALAWLRPGVGGAEAGRIATLLDRPRLAPTTTSAGRLFDAAAALVLGLETAEYDGQPAMMLEAIADPSEPASYPLPLVPGTPGELDWRPLIAAVHAEILAGVAPGTVAARFHRGLARGIAAACGLRPDLPVVITGGVFQNRRLTEWAVEALDRGPSRLETPGPIPPGDGGLAAGQLAIAVEQALEQKRTGVNTHVPGRPR